MDPSVATTSSPSWAVYCQSGQPSSSGDGGGHFSFPSDSSVPMAKRTRINERPSDLAKRTVLVFRPQTSTSAQQAEPAFFRDWLKANFNVPNEAVHEVKVVGVEKFRVAMVLLDESKTLDNIYEIYKSSNQQYARIGCYVQKASDALLDGATALNREAQNFAPPTSVGDDNGAIADLEESINLMLSGSGQAQLAAAYNKNARSVPTTPQATTSIPPTPFSAPYSAADAGTMFQAMMQQQLFMGQQQQQQYPSNGR